jgi:hypothetical protein
MIGFDLDGVLVSDIDWNSMTIQDYSLRFFMFPLFIPTGDYVIITGRPEEDRLSTLEWVEKFLYGNLPQEVFCKNTDYRKAELYKASVLNSLNLELYVESSEEQCYYLRKTTSTKIVHFSSEIMKLWR